MHRPSLIMRLHRWFIITVRHQCITTPRQALSIPHTFHTAGAVQIVVMDGTIMAGAVSIMAGVVNIVGGGAAKAVVITVGVIDLARFQDIY